ncbi:MAG: DUF547 domain-containing protein [Candidatus Accumulibacter necessarius]|jgi:hypothetical protein
MLKVKSLLVVCLLSLLSSWALAYDHTHGDWSTLLAQHVRLAADGKASRVDYAGMAADRAALNRYLASLSAVSAQEYAGWPKPQRLAFLINAYNAFTIDLVLSRYPDVKSIKDLGSTFRSPWKRKFILLLGQERSLDDVEHGLIRAPGAFDEPRIHVAVVCASIGCPMLPKEAFTADQLDSQFENAMRRFLSDATRNRFDAAAKRLSVSRIFDWYGKDFEQGHQGFDSLRTTFRRYAEQLASTPEARALLVAGDYRIEFLDYDWRLNDVVRNGKP